VEACSSDTAEKATEEKQERTQDQQPGATQSQLLLKVGIEREREVMERGGTKSPPGQDGLPQPKAMERSLQKGEASHIWGAANGKMLF
jgi:hypothetical protein